MQFNGMFGKLRRNILILNMALMTLVITVSFATSYLLVRENTMNGISMSLDRAAMDMNEQPPFDSPDIPMSGESEIPSGEHRQNNRPPELNLRPPEGDIKRPLTNRRFFDGENLNSVFVLSKDSDGNVIRFNTRLNIDSEQAEEIVTAMLSKNSVADGEVGRYDTDDMKLAYTVTMNENRTVVAVKEISAELSILNNLVSNFVLVFIAAVILIGIISMYFAQKAIAPIELMWEKQKRFIEDASHELKTPLAVIATNIDVLLANGEENEDKKWLRYIKDETVRMNKLTVELLDLARLDATDSQVILESVDVSACLEESVLGMEALAFEKGVNIETDIKPVKLMANTNHIKQLIIILLDNALKYTEKGGRIDAVLTCDDKNAYLRIKNTGEGMSEFDCEHIFDRFYRIDRSRTRESGGHGLGLSIAKSICEKYGGKIFASSKQGNYTEISVQLPMNKKIS